MAGLPFHAGRAGRGSEVPSWWRHRRSWHYRTLPPCASEGISFLLACDKAPPQARAFIQVRHRRMHGHHGAVRASQLQP